MEKKISLQDFLTAEQITRCAQLYKTHLVRTFTKQSTDPFAKVICNLVIKPNIIAINEKLGQENDPMFLAYAIEYIFNEASK